MSFPRLPNCCRAASKGLLLACVSMFFSPMLVQGADAPSPATKPVQVEIATQAMALPVSPGYHQRHCAITAGEVKLRMSFGLFLPASYFESQEPFPLLITLSTAGARGVGGGRLDAEGMCSYWTPEGPRVSENSGKVNIRKTARFIGLAPQCPSKYDWKNQPIPQALSELINELAKTYRIDQDRIYVTGFSYGGTNTWEMAEALPERFAAIAPISGRATANPEQDMERLRNVGIYLAVGSADKPFLPLSERMHEALKATHHPNFVYRVVPNGGHGCYTEVYTDPRFWEWLYAQSRKKNPATAPANH